MLFTIGRPLLLTPLLALLLGAASPALGQQVVYVNAALATGNNDGTSWANAFRGRLGLKTALDLAVADSNTQLWIAKGSYAPASAGGDRMISFSLKNGVALYGGFAGSETLLEQRSPSVNITILSGDLNQNDGAASRPTTNDNAHHVLRADNCDATAVLDGLTIRHGDASLFGGSDVIDRQAGGGIIINNSSPTITSCTFAYNNSGFIGGGVAIRTGSPSIQSCTFIGNRASFGGGGLINTGGTNSTISDCTFQQNQGTQGSGMFTGAFSGEAAGANAPTISDCSFLSNTNAAGGGQGIGLYDRQGTALVDNCLFFDNNTGAGGGGIFLEQSASTIRNCRLVRNTGSFDGGDAIYIVGGTPFFEGCVIWGHCLNPVNFAVNAVILVNSGAKATFTNCTITANGSAQGFTAIYAVSAGSTAILRNSIVWGNTSSAGQGFASAVRFTFGGNATADFSTIQGWAGQLAGTGNSAVNPQFADMNGADNIAATLDDDFRLLAASSCIDASDNALLSPTYLVDFAGRPRRYDAPTADTGSGLAPIADRGAFEYTCPSDLNLDNMVDLTDFFDFLNAFDSSASPADIDGSGNVDLGDFFLFLNAFDASC